MDTPATDIGEHTATDETSGIPALPKAQTSTEYTHSPKTSDKKRGMTTLQ